MTGPRYPGRVLDLTDQQAALVVVARLHMGLRVADLEPLLVVCIPDATVPQRARRYSRVQLAVSRYDDLACGELDPAAFLGRRDPDDDSDEDDRLHAAAILAWFEVTDVVMRAAPAPSTVDQHAGQIIAALTAPEQAGQVAA